MGMEAAAAAGRSAERGLKGASVVGQGQRGIERALPASSTTLGVLLKFPQALGTCL